MVTCYKASDGKLFDSEQECAAYEKKRSPEHKAELKKEINNLKETINNAQKNLEALEDELEELYGERNSCYVKTYYGNMPRWKDLLAW